MVRNYYFSNRDAAAKAGKRGGNKTASKPGRMAEIAHKRWTAVRAAKERTQ